MKRFIYKMVIEKRSRSEMSEEINKKLADTIKIELKAVIDGEVIRIEEIEDPVFSSKMIGNGYGIIPTGKKLYSPISGTVEEIASTKHAVYLSGTDGLKLLIHLGIDTIELKGEGFKSQVEKGMSIEKGDLLVTFDPDFIRDKGLNPVVSVIILDQKEKEMDVIVYPTEEAKANESLALKANIY